MVNFIINFEHDILHNIVLYTDKMHQWYNVIDHALFMSYGNKRLNITKYVQK